MRKALVTSGRTAKPARKARKERAARSRAASLSDAQFIESLFFHMINVTENGVKRRISQLEVIILRLWSKAASDRKAARALRKYQSLRSALARARTLEIAFEADDYTRSLEAGPSHGDKND